MISMNDVIKTRLAQLRGILRREKLSAFIFPSTDPHNGEYVPDRWKGREWVSGFNGSAGTVVVTLDAAALWTDSRYFIAAAQQLEGTGIELMRLKMPETPTIPQWIGRKLSQCERPEVGIDGMVNSIETVESLIWELRRQGGITVRTNFDPLAEAWKDRPRVPDNKICIHPIEYAGVEACDKIALVRKTLAERHVDGMLISALDDIAWVLNLRGADVRCNPVFVSYLLLSQTSATLYINSEKVPADVEGFLLRQGVKTDQYGNVAKGLADYREYNILLDPGETSYSLFKAVRRAKTVSEKSPVPALKAIKNKVEIEGFRNAMLKDGIAMVKFLKWLKPAVTKGGETEMSLDRKLTALRAEQPLFRDISFDTIAGYGEHAAIVHYEATPETDIPVEPHGMILIDSGAQYLDGTTDITRTIALGPVTDYEKHIYTLVLKGHIQLELCKFPKGAAGTQMDILARQAMWREGLNYLHGTGHGVGSYLNVHEGPHQFRMEWMPAPFVEGMTVTDEPGVYLPGRFGVRIENTMIVEKYKETEFGEFLQFDSLTLCPIDTAPIDKEMLLPEETAWLNSYHQKVYDTIAPHLDGPEREWLKEATKAI